jgi:hypothetical protein
LLDSAHYFKGVNVKIVGTPAFSLNTNQNLHYYLMREKFETFILDMNSEDIKSWDLGPKNLPYSKILTDNLLAKK